MSNLTDFARSELERAGMFDKDSDYGCMLGEEGHSGLSASMAMALFEKVARFEPLTPLTGEDDEWTDVGNGVFQNRRCPHVFKENGAAYDIEGVIFREPSGACFTSRDSRVPVIFPYVPTREYRDVPADR